MLLDLAFPLPLPRQRDAGAVVRRARRHAAARVRRSRRHLALSGRASTGLAAVPAGAAELRGPLVLAASAASIRGACCAPAGNGCGSGRVVSGGSTLTMQVARILDPHARTHRGGKLRQLLRALQLEVHLTKREILALYLNRAPFGGTIEGVEAASWAYLGKPAARLSHAEAALLAVLPQSPSRLRPDREPEARARRARQGAGAHGDARRVVARARSPTRASNRWSRVRCSRRCMRALLAQRLRDAHPRGGAHRVARIDIDLQRTLEERVSAYFSRPAGAHLGRVAGGGQRARWRRAPTSARSRSPTRRGSATSTWSRPGVRRARR